jgi:hypothetical protein
VALERERVHGHRVRPARRSRWRRYTPALTAVFLAAALIAGLGPVGDLGARLTIGVHASATIAASLAVLATVTAAALCDRSPARWYVAGALAVSLGANLAPPRGVALPLAALGLGGVLAQEVARAFDGITLGPEGITLHRPLKDPLTVDYEAIEAVHTAPALEGAGALILETQHGTVTARDLPRVEQLQSRIEARTSRVEIDDPEETARKTRKRIQSLLRGETPA